MLTDRPLPLISVSAPPVKLTVVQPEPIVIVLWLPEGTVSVPLQVIVLPPDGALPTAGKLGAVSAATEAIRENTELDAKGSDWADELGNWLPVRVPPLLALIEPTA